MSKNTKKDTRRKYTKEFKLDVVKEHKQGKTLTELSKKYSIAPSTLGTWFSLLDSEVEVGEDEIVLDTDTLDQVKELKQELEDAKGKVEVLELKLEDREGEIDRLNKKLKSVPKEDQELGSWVAKVEELEAESEANNDYIKQLEEEVKKLHEVIMVCKDEARREIKTLKDAIIIMAKNYDEEE